MNITYLLCPDGVRSALDALGATADEVAATLLAGGHRGQPEECDACPIAVYLAATFPGCKTSVVDSEHGLSAVVSSATVAASVTVMLPGACIEFVAGFDDCRYSSLILPDTIEESDR